MAITEVQIEQVKNGLDHNLKSIKERQDQHTFEVMEKAKEERNVRLDEATRYLLEKIGIPAEIGGKYKKEVWGFFKRTINNRTRPNHRWKMAYALDPQSERVARLLDRNIQKDPEDKAIFSSNNVCVIKKTDSNKRTVEIHYGGGEIENDKEFVSEILKDPNKFLIDKGIPIFGTKIKIIFRNPTDVPVSEKIVSLFKQDSQTSHSKTKVDYSEEALPMDFDQLKKLDLLSSSVKIREMVGRHHKERYLEVSENDVKKVVDQIVVDLEKTSPNSNLLKLIRMDQEFVVSYVYNKAKDEKDGDLSLCIGNLFEAVVQIEMRNGVNNDFLSETVWQKANLKRIRTNGTPESLKEYSGKTIMGEELDLVGTKALEIRKKYQDYCRKYGLANCDLLVVENIKYIDSVSSEIKEKKVPTVMVEIKSKDSIDILESERRQLSSQIEALPQFLDWYNNQDIDEKLEMPEIRNLTLVVIRPNSKNSIPDKPSVVNNNLVYTIRSSITTDDLKLAINSKDSVTEAMS